MAGRDLDQYAARYGSLHEERAFEAVMFQVRKRHVLASLRRHPHRHILEIGCGPEPIFLDCDDFETYTVVEGAAAFADRARALAAGRGEITVIAEPFETAYRRLAGRALDFVILSSLLHEVPDPRALLGAVRAVCGEATRVAINVPNARSFHRLLAVEMGLIESVFEFSGMNRYLNQHAVFDMASLLQLLDESGFRTLASGTYFVKPFTHEQMRQALASGAIDMAVIDGLDAMTKHLPDLGAEIFVEAARA
jgi:hypothetical protein